MVSPSPQQDLEKTIASEQIEDTSNYVSLSDEHRQYLTKRHGTIELEPLPDINDANPLNWPKKKKIINLVLVAFHGMMATFTAAAIQSAFAEIAVDLGVSIQKASYLTSLAIAIIGGAPLLWRPLSDRFGRRPIFLVSLVGSFIGNLACAKSISCTTMGLCRAITAFCICPAIAIGSAVVSECFFKHQRARYMGIWTLMVTLGIPSAPFLFGFVALRIGYRWIYWILACTNAVQFLLYLFFGPETRYLSGCTRSNNMFQFRRIDPAPLKLWDFLHPLALTIRPCVFIPAVAYSMVFSLAGILIAIEIPQLFHEKFHFNTQQIGMQNLSMIIGSVVGEQVGGFMSDKWMSLRYRKEESPKPEFRLLLTHIGYVFSIVGVIMFLVCLQQAGEDWNITLLVGAGLAAGGNQVVTTVLITYSVDCYPKDAAAIGTFISFVRQIWGFIGPFWYPLMIESVGLSGSAGLTTALMVGVSVLPTAVLQWKGNHWRGISTEK